MNKKFLVIILTFIILGIYIFKEGKIVNIDNYAYVVAIGIDSGVNAPLKVSFQIANTSDSGSSSETSSTTSKSIVSSVETSSIDNAVNLINTYISKELSLTHCRAIVISEELAYSGILEYLYPLFNKTEISPKANVIISSIDCESFLKEASKSIEKNSTKYYNIIPTTFDFTGYTDNITLRDFFSKLGDTFAEPYASLGNVNKNNTENSMLFYLKDENKYSKDNPSTVKSPDNIGMNGIAVFNKDKLVGKLNSMETICHLILNNKLKKAIISIPSPFNDSNSIDLSISLRKNTNFDVKLINRFAICKM